MPITTAFTVTAFLAIFFNVWFLTRAIRRRLLLSEYAIDGDLRLIANTLIRVWGTILLADVLVFAAGAGLILGVRVLGYLLAVMPVASTFVGIFALRGLLRKGGI